MKFIKLFFSSIFTVCFLLTSISILINKKSMLLFLFFLACSILLAFLSISIYKKPIEIKEKKIIINKKEQKERKTNDKLEKYKLTPGSIARIRELQADVCIQAKHMAGLPIAQDALTYLYLCEDKIIFERNETKYNLEMNKIKDITMKTDLEIQKAYVSSIGGAVAGGVLFGPLGAIIGGRTKTKVNKKINNYLIFTYDKDNNIEFISFDVTGIIKAHKFVDFFIKNRSRERKEINL